ncbi:unnamed protein product, partial [Allacma fusca]
AYVLLNSNGVPMEVKPGDFLGVYSRDNGHHSHDDGPDPHSHEAIENAAGPKLPVSFHSPDEEAHAGEAVEAQRLYKEVRVLCWVMTAPSNHEKKAIHVKNTWGARCNKLIFMSSQTGTNSQSEIVF